MSHRRHRRRRGGGPPPIFLLPVALILGLIVLVVVFGGVVSVLGGLAVTGLVCFAPLVLIGARHRGDLEGSAAESRCAGLD